MRTCKKTFAIAACMLVALTAITAAVVANHSISTQHTHIFCAAGDPPVG